MAVDMMKGNEKKKYSSCIAPAAFVAEKGKRLHAAITVSKIVFHLEGGIINLCAGCKAAEHSFKIHRKKFCFR